MAAYQPPEIPKRTQPKQHDQLTPVRDLSDIEPFLENGSSLNDDFPILNPDPKIQYKLYSQDPTFYRLPNSYINEPSSSTCTHAIREAADYTHANIWEFKPSALSTRFARENAAERVKDPRYSLTMEEFEWIKGLKMSRVESSMEERERDEILAKQCCPWQEFGEGCDGLGLDEGGLDDVLDAFYSKEEAINESGNDWETDANSTQAKTATTWLWLPPRRRSTQVQQSSKATGKSFQDSAICMDSSYAEAALKHLPFTCTDNRSLDGMELCHQATSSAQNVEYKSNSAANQVYSIPRRKPTQTSSPTARAPADHIITPLTPQASQENTDHLHASSKTIPKKARSDTPYRASSQLHTHNLMTPAANRTHYVEPDELATPSSIDLPLESDSTISSSIRGSPRDQTTKAISILSSPTNATQAGTRAMGQYFEQTFSPADIDDFDDNCTMNNCRRRVDSDPEDLALTPMDAEFNLHETSVIPDGGVMSIVLDEGGAPSFQYEPAEMSPATEPYPLSPIINHHNLAKTLPSLLTPIQHRTSSDQRKATPVTPTPSRKSDSRSHPYSSKTMKEALKRKGLKKVFGSSKLGSSPHAHNSVSFNQTPKSSFPHPLPRTSDGDMFSASRSEPSRIQHQTTSHKKLNSGDVSTAVPSTRSAACAVVVPTKRAQVAKRVSIQMEGSPPPRKKHRRSRRRSLAGTVPITAL